MKRRGAHSAKSLQTGLDTVTVGLEANRLVCSKKNSIVD